LYILVVKSRVKIDNDSASFIFRWSFLRRYCLPSLHAFTLSFLWPTRP